MAATRPSLLVIVPHERAPAAASWRGHHTPQASRVDLPATRDRLFENRFHIAKVRQRSFAR